MNEVFAKFEELTTSELTMVLEYLIELINYRKEQERLNKKLLKQKENLITDSQTKCSSVQNAAG